MKPSERNYPIFAGILLWLMPVLLIVPNVALVIMGRMDPVPGAANVLLPLGVYLLLMSWSRKVGRSVVLLFPVAFFCAFQIVLLFLYLDGSVIAVDMFLNVVTTNSSEAFELLGNLLNAVGCVVLLYLPVTVAGMVAWVRRRYTSAPQRRGARLTGIVSASLGAVMVVLGYVALPDYRVEEELFPVNILCNLETAIERTVRTERYAQNPPDFRYEAVSTRPDAQREVYIAVVGETSRADHYQLLGYNRFTTPRLCALDSLVCFDHVMSESNTTHKAVPMLLTTLTTENFEDIYGHRSIISAFKEAGFHTAFLSMQCRNHSFIDFFAEEADTTVFMREPEPGQVLGDVYDTDFIPAVRSLIESTPGKLLIVLHAYGSHFNYEDRYPRSEAFFLPDKAAEAVPSNRPTLINAYDNSIRLTDELLASLAEVTDSLFCPAAWLYASDHGEDIYDDERGRFLHASPTATFRQLNVPMMMYFNRPYRQAYAQKWRAADAARHLQVSSSEAYSHTLMDMAGLDSPRLNRQDALTSGRYESVSNRRFINDRNRSVTLDRAGFTPDDYMAMSQAGIR